MKMDRQFWSTFIAVTIVVLGCAGLLTWLLRSFGVEVHYGQSLAALVLVRFFLTPWKPSRDAKERD